MMNEVLCIFSGSIIPKLLTAHHSYVHVQCSVQQCPKIYYYLNNETHYLNLDNELANILIYLFI